MRDFARRRGSGVGRRFLISLASALALLLLCVLMVRAALGMYGKFAEAARSDALAQQKLSDMKAQAAQVSASVESLDSQRGIEQEVRERYGVAKPGEGQIKIVREAATTSIQTPQSPNFFMRVWGALFSWI